MAYFLHTPAKVHFMNTGDGWIIDDDKDDRDSVIEIWKDLHLPNELVCFSDAASPITRLKEEQAAPFMIMCDVNLPKIDGFELREMMLKEPSKKFHSVPFIFWSTFASEAQIARAYDLSAHGFFIKEINYSELKQSFHEIILYWQKSKMPDKKD